jgi:uncharacterized membrane protein
MTPTMSRRTQWTITGCISVRSIAINISHFFYRTFDSDGDVGDSPLAKTTLFEAYMWVVTNHVSFVHDFIIDHNIDVRCTSITETWLNDTTI